MDDAVWLGHGREDETPEECRARLRREWMRQFKAVEDVDGAGRPARLSGLARDYVEALIEKIDEGGIDPRGREAARIWDAGERAFGGIDSAYIPDRWGDDDRVRVDPLWHAFSRARLLDYAEEGRRPPFSTGSVDGAASDYLDGPIRAPSIDRVLIASLIGAEVGHYLAQAGAGRLKAHNEAIRRMRSMLHPLTRLLVTRLVGVVVWILAIIAAAALSSYFNWGDGLAVGVGFVGAAILVLWLLFGLAWLPQAYTAWRARSELLRGDEPALETLMMDAWELSHSAGKVGLDHLRSTLDASAKRGAIWPSSVYALIDDVRARGRAWL